MLAPTGGRILIVDDDADLRGVLAALLKGEGYGIVEAANGAEALRTLRENPASYDIILFDLLMPVMDGWAFREEQLQDPALESIPAIAMSARGRHAEARSLQVDAYLEKPFALSLLVEAVERCSKSSPPRGPR